MLRWAPAIGGSIDSRVVREFVVFLHSSDHILAL